MIVMSLEQYARLTDDISLMSLTVMWRRRKEDIHMKKSPPD